MGAEDHAILVGIRRYRAFETLEGPENDVDAVLEWLKDPAGGAVPDAHIHPIISSHFHHSEARPTTEDVYKAFDDLIDLAEANDPHPAGRRLYIFMAGHGVGLALREATLLMANAAPRRWGYSISGTAVADHFGKAAYFREIVLLMDCCRDALAEAQLNALPWQPVTGTSAHETRWLYGFATGFSRTAREKPIDGNIRGVFTVAVLEALRAGARTSSTLGDLVHARMTQLLDRDEYQRPYFQPGPIELQFDPPRAKLKLTILLARGSAKTVVTVRRGGVAPDVDHRAMIPGESWQVELDPGLYEILREDDGESTIVKITVEDEHVEI